MEKTPPIRSDAGARIGRAIWARMEMKCWWTILGLNGDELSLIRGLGIGI